jgi:Family of unknown function (DUF6328)
MAAKPKRQESEYERADRNLSELLQELRVALPGVQVLFAFLLTVPFSQGFTKITPFQEKLYFAILLSTAMATALLVAPTANHRLLFRKRDKERIVKVSNRLSIIGLVFLALAMCGVVLLISDFVFSPPTPVIATAGAVIVFGTLWFAMPLVRRVQMEELDD